jgi:dTDP-L-rhamnose 4-epimerase
LGDLNPIRFQKKQIEKSTKIGNMNTNYKKILVTGGAGFIGLHLVHRLIEEGYKVRVLDNLDPQVHGKVKGRPKNLPKSVEWMKGDVTHPPTVDRALKNIDAIFHLAAAVGVGQSMYQIRHYVNANSMGGGDTVRIHR